MPNASTQTDRTYSKYIKKTFGGKYKKYKYKYTKKKKYVHLHSKPVKKATFTKKEVKAIVSISGNQKATLISRRYFASNNGVFNVWGSGINNDADPQSNNWAYARFQTISSVPRIYTLSAIKKADINQVLNNPNDPNDNDGAVQGMITDTQHNHRMGNIIMIKGISLEFRLVNDLGITQLGAVPYLPIIQYQNLIEHVNNSYGRCNFYYKVIEVSTNSQTSLADKDEAALAAIMTEVLPFGYSAPLDKEIKETARQLKYKVLISGKVNLNCKIKIETSSQPALPNDAQLLPKITIEPKSKVIKVYKSFDKPIQIVYEPADQDGIAPENKIIYLAVKSDIDTTTSQSPIEEGIAPRMSCCSKVYYTEP